MKNGEDIQTKNKILFGMPKPLSFSSNHELENRGNKRERGMVSPHRYTVDSTLANSRKMSFREGERKMRIVVVGIKEKNEKVFFDEFFFPLIKQEKIKMSNIHSTKQVSGETTFAITDVDKGFSEEIAKLLASLVTKRIVKRSNIHFMEK